MTNSAIAGRTARVLALAAASFGLTACLAAPPAASAPARLGTVRAATSARAAAVARVFDELAPRVVQTVPDSHFEPLEVWVQETPTLYRLRASTYSDTDGFWAAGVRRIHLRESADQIERTLAHELVHASLGEVWERLPGTLEEGVCDWVAAQLVPHAAPRLRAGRLATAAAAIGGLPLEVELWVDEPEGGPLVVRGLDVHVRIVAESLDVVDPGDVFVVRAGLSTARATPAVRRALYGLGFLVAERIATRHGLEGLHAICAQADREGLDVVAAETLLGAAGLAADPQSFRDAIVEALGPTELREIVRLYPGVLLQPVMDLLEARAGENVWDALVGVRGRISVRGNPAAVVHILDMTALRPRLEAESAALWEPLTSKLAFGGKPASDPASDRAP